MRKRTRRREAESPDDADFTEEMLEETIGREMLGDGFCAEALDHQVARVCLALAFRRRTPNAGATCPIRSRRRLARRIPATAIRTRRPSA